MNLFKKLFRKTELKTLAKSVANFTPLNTPSDESEKFRNLLINHLEKVYGEKEVSDIIKNSEYACETTLFPDNPIISLRTKGEPKIRTFMINESESLEEMESA